MPRTELTYAEVGATRGELPSGYNHLHASRVLGTGDDVYQRAVAGLMSWEMHRRAGLAIESGPDRVADGADVVMRWLGRRIPCRVVYVVDEADRQGFAYGTLEGHPERGEESFVIECDPDTATVTATVTAFSKPGKLSTRLLGPLGRVLQNWMTNRYLNAL